MAMVLFFFFFSESLWALQAEVMQGAPVPAVAEGQEGLPGKPALIMLSDIEQHLLYLTRN